MGSRQNEVTQIHYDNKTIMNLVKQNCRRKWETKIKEMITNTHYGRINPRNHHETYMRDKNRALDVCLTRLRLGHTRLKEHLNRLRMENDPNCRFCGTQPESIEHILLICPQLQNHQQKLKDNLRKENIPTNLETIIGTRNMNQRQAKIVAANLKSYIKRTNLIEII